MRVVAVKDTMSAMVKPTTDIAESAFDAIDYGMVSYLTTHFHDELGKAMLSFLSWPTDCPM